MIMQDLLASFLGVVLIPFTLAVLLVALCERMPLGWSATHRSWLWRAVYVKTLIALCIPSWMMIGVPWLSVPRVDRIATKIASTQGKEVAISNATHIDTATHDTQLSAKSTTKDAMDATSNPVENPRWLVGMLWLWISGVAFCFAVVLIRYCQLNLRIRRSSSLPSSHLLHLSTGVSKQLGVRGLSKLVLSKEVQSPLILWSPRPWLVLPVDFEARFGMEGCRMAIAHELAHFRRKDLLWSMLTSSVSIALFFWPPAWFAARRYYLAMEMAADQYAIDSAHLPRPAYATLLLKLMEGRPSQTTGAMALAMAHSSSFYALRERVESMNRPWRRMIVSRTVTRAAALVLGFLVLLPWCMGDDTNRNGKRTKNRKPPAQSNSGSGQSNQNGESQDKPSNTISGQASSTMSGFTFGSSSGGGQAGGFAGGSLGGSGFGMGSGSGSTITGLQGSTSSSLSFGGQAPQEPISPGDQPSNFGSGLTRNRMNSTGSSFQQGGFGSMSTSTNRGADGVTVSRSNEQSDEEKITRTRIDTPTERVLIEESDIDGYTVTIQQRKRVRGQGKKIVTAEDLDALKEKDMVAHQWVERYHLRGGKDGPDEMGRQGIGAMQQIEATRMMENHLEQTMRETDDPVLRQQIQMMLNQIRNR
jgi:beta-lactamase regulating signal transducer with metallopeptidase domain